MPEDQYSDLSLATRRWLASLEERQLLPLIESCLRHYSNLHERTINYLEDCDGDKQPIIMRERARREVYELMSFIKRLSPEARQFLVASDPLTFGWLMKMEPEEIAFHRKRTKLSLALLTVGHAAKWLLIMFASVITGTVALIVAMQKLFGMLPWGGH